jgi:hypothetical protein
MTAALAGHRHWQTGAERRARPTPSVLVEDAAQPSI